MALFLNRNKLNYWINQLINEATDEIVIIVPYIQTSETIYSNLSKANNRGVKIVLIYREDKLSESEKNKLINLSNLTLLHHPNIHCKCYYNGDLLIIGSMNLYEYSEKNNREMGILLHKIRIIESENDFVPSDEAKIFREALNEVREIVNGSKLERLGESINARNFSIDILKSEEEVELERATELNQYFLNKKFKPLQTPNNSWVCICTNYFDNLDVILEHGRIIIEPTADKEILKAVFDYWKRSYNEFEFRGFKFYWNYHESNMYLYKDGKFDWDILETSGNEANLYKKYQIGINSVIDKYQKIIKKAL